MVSGGSRSKRTRGERFGLGLGLEVRVRVRVRALSVKAGQRRAQRCPHQLIVLLFFVPQKSGPRLKHGLMRLLARGVLTLTSSWLRYRRRHVASAAAAALCPSGAAAPYGCPRSSPHTLRAAVRYVDCANTWAHGEGLRSRRIGWGWSPGPF